MKTLIFNGSPRKNGDTVAMINSLKRELGGEINQIDTFYSDIKPCMDCRYCISHENCSINDDMINVFKLIDEADNIVVASPIYFSMLTGSLLNIFSRLQYIYILKRFHHQNILSNKKRNGIIFLAGGGDGSADKAIETAACCLKIMGANVIGTVCSHNTDNIPAAEDENAMSQIKLIAEKLKNY